MTITQETWFDIINAVPGLKQDPEVRYEGDYVIIKGRPIGYGILLRLFKNKDRIDYMFDSANNIQLKFHRFFTFEFIKILEYVENNKKIRYDVNRENIPPILNTLKRNIDNEEEYDIDRKHIDKTFEFKPKEHQDEFFKEYFKFKHHMGYRGGLLHGAVGSGKTLASLFLMEGLHTEIDKIFIICPLPTLEKVWLSTLSGEKGTGYKTKQSVWNVRTGKEYNNEKYIVCNYEAMDKLYAKLNEFRAYNVGIIIDECHNMNDPKSNRTKLLKDIVRDSRSNNVLPMSGTPLKTGVKELTTIFTLLDNNYTDAVEKRFQKLYSNPPEFLADLLKERYKGYSKYVSKDVLKLEPLETINLKIKLPDKVFEKYTLKNIKEDLKEYIKRRKEEILSDLAYWDDVYLRLRDKAYDLGKIGSYDRMKYEEAVMLIRQTNPRKLYTIPVEVEFANKFEKEQIIARLEGEEKKLFREAKTIYKYYMLKIRGEALANVIGKARMECHKEMCNYLDFDAILKATNKKTIIFSNYLEICNHVESLVSKKGYKPIGIYGDTTKELSSRVKTFTDDKKRNPLVTTFKSLSTGVPLIIADTIICIDMPFRMYIYEQAVGRAWRLGQDSTVTSFILEVENDEPNINSRNIDIIAFFEEEVTKITGISSSVGIKGEENKDEKLIAGEISVEEFELSIQDINVSKEEYDFSLSTEASKNPKRAAVESLILKYIDKIVTGKENTKLYQDLFASMNDKEFDIFMNKLKNKEINLSIIIPNGDNRFKVDLNNLMKLGKELGYDFFQHLNYGPNEDRPGFKTPNKHMVLALPVRRASQLVSKKISIPTDTSSIDTLSGQVTNSSKGSKITNPEIQILLGLGLKDSLTELLKIRGGDLGAARATEQLLYKHGSVSQQQANQYATDVVSKKTLKSYFNAMGISTTL